MFGVPSYANQFIQHLCKKKVLGWNGYTASLYRYGNHKSRQSKLLLNIRSYFHSYLKISHLKSRDEDPVLAKKPTPGLCTSKEGRFLKVFKANISDNFKSLLFCSHTFGVRRTIDVLDSDSQKWRRGKIFPLVLETFE